MKIHTLALSAALALLSGCGTVTSPQTGQQVPWYSCESAYSPSADCIIENQTGSVHGQAFTVKAIPAPPAGTEGDLTWTGVALVKPGTDIPVRLVPALDRRCRATNASLGCYLPDDKAIQVLSTTPRSCIMAVVNEELQHAAGLIHNHDARHFVACPRG